MKKPGWLSSLSILAIGSACWMTLYADDSVRDFADYRILQGPESVMKYTHIFNGDVNGVVTEEVVANDELDKEWTTVKVTTSIRGTPDKVETLSERISDAGVEMKAGDEVEVVWPLQHFPEGTWTWTRNETVHRSTASLREEFEMNGRSFRDVIVVSTTVDEVPGVKIEVVYALQIGKISLAVDLPDGTKIELVHQPAGSEQADVEQTATVPESKPGENDKLNQESRTRPE